jgi:hypothetical protein
MSGYRTHLAVVDLLCAGKWGRLARAEMNANSGMTVRIVRPQHWVASVPGERENPIVTLNACVRTLLSRGAKSCQIILLKRKSPARTFVWLHLTRASPTLFCCIQKASPVVRKAECWGKIERVVQLRSAREIHFPVEENFAYSGAILIAAEGTKFIKDRGPIRPAN